MKNIALVFPGQGSQSVGMLSDLFDEFEIVRESFDIASESLGYNLWEVTKNGPESELNKTWKTQPALLTASVAIHNLLQQKCELKPSFMAGHSLGEYSALVCSGVLDFRDAVQLVELRGKLMQEAVPEGKGAMSAIIGLDNALIEDACKEAAQGQIVSPVNYNSPGQVVIAGEKEAVERANILCKSAGAKRALMLAVSVPSHCLLMKPIAARFGEALDKLVLSQPNVPVIHNVDVATFTDSNSVKDALLRQLYSPVRWSETVSFMADNGVTRLLEIGPGKVLSGLAKRIDERVTAISINDLSSLNTFLDESINN